MGRVCVQVGVGCFVLNERQEVLVVQEANGPLRGKGVWKLVTGLVDAGEDIVQASPLPLEILFSACHLYYGSPWWQSTLLLLHIHNNVVDVGLRVANLGNGSAVAGDVTVQAAEREVLEETGVRATSAAVLAFRQAHGFAFGKSDFFFVIALTCALWRLPRPPCVLPPVCSRLCKVLICT